MKIHEYNEMMSYLTRPAQPITTRENFAESIEPKIKKYKELVKAGTSTTDAKNKVIKLFKLKRSKSAGTPVWAQKGKEQLIQEGVLEDIERGTIKTIGETEDFSKNKDIKKLSTETVEPSIKKVTYENKATGKKFVRYKPLMRSNTVTVSGAGFDTIEKARKTVEDYNKANPKKMAVTLKLEEDLKKLADSPRLKPLLKTGTPDKKYLKVVQDILDINVSQAEDKLKQLGEAVRPNSSFDVPGINKISEKKAKNISDFYKSKSVSKTVVDKEIGKSVGEKSLKNLRADVQRELPFSGGPETFETDEAKAKMGSFRLGSKPYSIFGQVIDGRLNQGDKMAVDSQLSRLEEDVQKALKGELVRDGKKITPKEAVTRYNQAVTEAENLFNKQKMRNFKSVRIPKISLKSPDETIANKAAYKKYKQYFDKNFKELGYSFQIPKDLRPIPEIASDLKDKSSPAYKTMIKNVKEIGKKFIKNIDEYDEKELLKIFDNPKFQQFKKFIPRLTSVDDFSERRYASANNIMTDATYIDDEGEQTFAERNPLTTTAAGAAGTAGILAGSKLSKSDPLKKPRRFSKKIAKQLASIPLKTLGSVTSGLGFAGSELASEDPNLAVAGADLLLPEIGKKLPSSGTGIMSKIGRGVLNPFGVLEKFGKYGKLGRAVAMGARIPSLMTPAGLILIGAEGVKKLYDAEQEEKARVEAMSPEDRESYLQEKQDTEEFMARASAAYGGRIGFADGPEDPSKRKFMKIMGGLASLPIVGRFIKIGEQAPAVVETFKGAPEWFGTLVDKVIKTGVDATKRFATKDREEVFEKFMGEQEGVRVYRDLETGDTRVEYFSPDNMGGDSVDLVYKAPEQLVDGTTVPGEFKAVELEPRGVSQGPDDYDIEFDGENVVESVEDLMSDTSRLEEFATGKSIDLDKAKIAKEKRNKVGKINEDQYEQAQYLENKYGPGPEPDDYD